jgi:hypothetical protein
MISIVLRAQIISSAILLLKDNKLGTDTLAKALDRAGRITKTNYAIGEEDKALADLAKIIH